MRQFLIRLIFKTGRDGIFPVNAISPGEAMQKVLTNNNIEVKDLHLITVKVGEKIV